MFLGIDLGTSSVKVILVDQRGSVLGEGDADYPYYGAENGYFEQEPSDWTNAIISAITSLRTKLPESLWQGIESIGLSAQMPTMVLMGRDGKVIDRALVWCDSRADRQSKKLLSLWGKDLP